MRDGGSRGLQASECEPTTEAALAAGFPSLEGACRVFERLYRREKHVKTPINWLKVPRFCAKRA